MNIVFEFCPLPYRIIPIKLRLVLRFQKESDELGRYIYPMGGGALYAPSSFAFCLLLKIILRHPCLKILDLANLFVADAPMKKNQEI